MKCPNVDTWPHDVGVGFPLPDTVRLVSARVCWHTALAGDHRWDDNSTHTYRMLYPVELKTGGWAWWSQTQGDRSFWTDDLATWETLDPTNGRLLGYTDGLEVLERWGIAPPEWVRLRCPDEPGEGGDDIPHPDGVCWHQNLAYSQGHSMCYMFLRRQGEAFGWLVEEYDRRGADMGVSSQRRLTWNEGLDLIEKHQIAAGPPRWLLGYRPRGNGA